MSYTTLATQIDDGILTLTLNRPEQMNAFTVDMAHELVDVYRSASANDAVRAIVVTGAGKAFCAGMDLSREGNVFGLNEGLQPTLQDMQERQQNAAYGFAPGVRQGAHWLCVWPHRHRARGVL
jgi:enoyl-CoA hydratase/carnithine racemase